MSAVATTGVVLGALYMLRFAQGFLFGGEKAPHLPVVDLTLREKAILAAIVAAILWLGLFPDEPMRKSELAAQEYRQLVTTSPAFRSKRHELARVGIGPLAGEHAAHGHRAS